MVEKKLTDNGGNDLTWKTKAKTNRVKVFEEIEDVGRKSSNIIILLEKNMKNSIHENVYKKRTFREIQNLSKLKIR